MAERTALAQLHAEVARFYIRDRALLRAQTTFGKALESTESVDVAAARAYLRAVRRYFDGFEREARVHLKDIEVRLARVSQLQFNLSAERGVAVRRVEVTQGVLARLREIGGR